MFKALIVVAIIIMAAIACLALVPVTITDADNAKTIDVLRFRTIKLSLDSNPTTGYRWQLVSPADRRVLRLYYSAYLPQPTKLMGVGGREEWKFRAIQPGTVTVKLVYIRTWERNPPAKVFTLTVRVR